MLKRFAENLSCQSPRKPMEKSSGCCVPLTIGGRDFRCEPPFQDLLFCGIFLAPVNDGNRIAFVFTENLRSGR